MAWHKMELDDEKHRSVVLNRELSSNPDFSAMITYSEDDDGNLVNYIVIKSTKAVKAFEDLKIEAETEVKIPPSVG